MDIATSHGRNFSFGGGGGSVHYSYTAPPGYAIVGFIGRQGSYIDAVGVILEQVIPSCRPE